MRNEPYNTASTDDEYAPADLTRISGIGRAYAEALNKIGVSRFGDLAQYTPQDLAQALAKQGNVKVSAERIAADDWIGQARNLARPVAAMSRSAEPAEVIFRRGDAMDEIKMQRGGRAVTFRKVPDRFAVRLQQGRIASASGLESSLGRPETAVRHVDAVASAKMDVYSVEDAAKLEQTVDRMRQAPAVEVVSHVYAIDETPGGEVIPTGTLTLQFKSNVTKTQREAVLAAYGLEIVEDIHFLRDAYTVRLTSASQENPLKIAAKLQQMPEIETAEPDLSVKVAFQYTPTDDRYPQQWHLRNRGDSVGLTAGADVKAEQAWEITRGSRTITICIIDDGFDLTHPEFSHPGKIVAPRDFGQNDLDPNPVYAGDNHGTACAGVALAEEDGHGVVGLAPECALMPVRMAAWFDDDTIVSYFQYAVDGGADVISCSWTASALYYPLSVKLQGIIHFAAAQGRRNKKGCVILFAAGNENRPLDGVWNGQLSVQGFALHPDVVAVGASNSMDQRSAYSNYGSELSICAPSSGSPGRGIVTTDRRGIYGYTSGDYRTDFGGTSSATPLAAGLAALILTANPDLTAAEVKQIMMDTADKIDPVNGDYANGHSPWYGHGRINAEQAVAQAIAHRGNRNGAADADMQAGIEILDIVLSLLDPSPDVPTRRLQAELQMRVTGTDAALAADARLAYCIEVNMTNMASHTTQCVAIVHDRLQPTILEYTRGLEFLIPAPGEYETEGSVSLSLPASVVSTCYSGGKLTVHG